MNFSNVLTYYRAIPFANILKGDYPGHPFHGNQWTVGTSRYANTAYDTHLFVPEIPKGLKALGGVGGHVTQPNVTDAKSLYAQAKEAQPQFEAMMDRVGKSLNATTYSGNEGLKQASLDMKSGKSGTMMLVAPLKGEKRLEEKVRTEQHGKYDSIADVVRGTIAVDSVSQIPQVLAALKADGIELARAPKDRYSTPNPAQHGYRDILLNVRMPNGHAAELQINTKSMITAKNEQGHHHYEIERTITGMYNQKNSELKNHWDLNDVKKVLAARAMQRRIYGKAWAASP